METKTKFIGIDFSKATFDATIYEGEHCKFTNDDQGSKEFLAWVETHIDGLSLQDCLFCGENTGNYSVRLSNFSLCTSLYDVARKRTTYQAYNGISKGKG